MPHNCRNFLEPKIIIFIIYVLSTMKGDFIIEWRRLLLIMIWILISIFRSLYKYKKKLLFDKFSLLKCLSASFVCKLGINLNWNLESRLFFVLIFTTTTVATILTRQLPLYFPKWVLIRMFQVYLKPSNRVKIPIFCDIYECDICMN